MPNRVIKLILAVIKRIFTARNSPHGSHVRGRVCADAGREVTLAYRGALFVLLVLDLATDSPKRR